jgi:hypothetical protein
MRAFPLANPPPERRFGIARLVEQRLAAEPGNARARDLDAAIDASVLDAYELTRAERALI